MNSSKPTQCVSCQESMAVRVDTILNGDRTLDPKEKPKKVQAAKAFDDFSAPKLEPLLFDLVDSIKTCSRFVKSTNNLLALVGSFKTLT